MADVAREAGVSLVTVSRVINQPDKVAPETLAQVRAAIDRLRYVPNLTAGSLASNRSRIIAAVVPTLASSIFSDTIDGLSQSLARAGYQLLVGQTQFDGTQEVRVVDAFIGRRVDGLVLIRSADGHEVDERLAVAGIPFVQAWELGDQSVELSVGFSNFDAGAAAGRYLIERGYERLGFIGSGTGRARARLDGLMHAARAAGQPTPVARLVGPLDAVGQLGPAIDDLRRRHAEVRAVLCANDMVAAGVVFECQRRGIAVPDQLAVMGFADLPIAAAMYPALTTVHVQAREIGYRAGETLMARLGTDLHVDARIDLGYEVVRRESA